MRLLCLDVGDRRIGLAISDPSGVLASPLGFIERGGRRTGLGRDVGQVVQRAEQEEAGAIVVGMPLSVDGSIGPQARKVQRFLRALKGATDLPVETADERFSTAEAERLLAQTRPLASRSRGEIDAGAAAVILQGYLDQRLARPCS